MYGPGTGCFAPVMDDLLPYLQQLRTQATSGRRPSGPHSFPVKYRPCKFPRGDNCYSGKPKSGEERFDLPSVNPERIGSPIRIVQFRMYCPPSASDVPSASEGGRKSKSTALPAPAWRAIPARRSSTRRMGEVHHQAFENEERLFVRRLPAASRADPSSPPVPYRGG